MLTVLALGVAETAINQLFNDLSDDDKAPLMGKTLRIHVGELLAHRLVFNVAFDTNKARFEPALSPILPDEVDCTLSVANITELMVCLTNTTDPSDYAITGDDSIIHTICHIIQTHPKSQTLINRFYLHF